MTVECENCNTRFHVADARIPEKGARVRCSRCHHRFHITPSSAASKQPRAGAKSSADEAVPGGEAAREQDQLDNPEFIFDRPEGDPGKAGRARPIEAAHETVREQPHLAEPPEPETPPPPPEEHIVESGGLTAQQMLDDGIPEIPTGRFDLESSLGETDSLIGAADDPNAASARSLKADEPIETGEAADLAPPARPAFADIAAIAAELGEDEDSSFTDWDPLATPSTQSSATAPLDLAPRSGTSVLEPAKPAPVARAKRRPVPDAPAFDPEAASPIGLVLRIAALVVGVALLGAAARLLWLQRGSETSAPEVVSAAGWIAADVETLLARNASGERVVVVRGNLFPEGAAPPPAVEVRLLGANGEALVESPQTWLERIDDAEVAPERLALRLASAGGEIGGIGQLVTGFTAVISDPPPGVYRVQVSLRARERAPAGTATADAPPDPLLESATELATETSLPGPAALPDLPGAADVVPAAPGPE